MSSRDLHQDVNLWHLIQLGEKSLFCLGPPLLNVINSSHELCRHVNAGGVKCGMDIHGRSLLNIYYPDKKGSLFQQLDHQGEVYTYTCGCKERRERVTTYSSCDKVFRISQCYGYFSSGKQTPGKVKSKYFVFIKLTGIRVTQYKIQRQQKLNIQAFHINEITEKIQYRNTRGVVRGSYLECSWRTGPLTSAVGCHWRFPVDISVAQMTPQDRSDPLDSCLHHSPG